MCILHDTVNSKLFWSELAFAGTPHNQEREKNNGCVVVVVQRFPGLRHLCGTSAFIPDYGPRFWTEVTNFRATWGWIWNVQVVSAIIKFYVERAHVLSKVELVMLFHLKLPLEYSILSVVCALKWSLWCYYSPNPRCIVLPNSFC